MKLLTSLFSLGCLTLLLFFQASASWAGTETKYGAVLFAEDFESYAPGAKEIKTFASFRNAEVVEESFYPGSDHQGERSLRLAEYNRPDKPDTRVFCVPGRRINVEALWARKSCLAFRKSGHGSGGRIKNGPLQQNLWVNSGSGSLPGVSVFSCLFHSIGDSLSYSTHKLCGET